LEDGFSILMPAGLRLRTVRPLADRDGCCTLLYDLERSILIDVPDGFHHHVAVALETGDLDEGLLAWLAEEDVLTFERRLAAAGLEGSERGLEGGPDADPWASPLAVRSHVDLAVGQVLFAPHRVVARLQVDDERAILADLAALLGSRADAPPLTLLLGGDEPVRRFDVVRRVVAEARRHQRSTGREIAFELTLDPAAASSSVASLLAENRFEVRVAAGSTADLAASGARRAGLRALLDRLPERVTVVARLASGDRLRDLWRWVQGAGVQRFEAFHFDAFEVDDAGRLATELRHFRGDLFDLCDDLYAALEQGCSLPIYEPVARTVRRLTAGRPLLAEAGGGGGFLGQVTHGRVVPLLGGCSADALWAGGGDWSEAPSGGDGRALAFRRAEIEVALLFYGRLRAADATCLLGFPAEGPRPPFDAVPAAGPAVLKVC
jgi:hypothetical protein